MGTHLSSKYLLQYIPTLPGTLSPILYTYMNPLGRGTQKPANRGHAQGCRGYNRIFLPVPMPLYPTPMLGLFLYIEDSRLRVGYPKAEVSYRGIRRLVRKVLKEQHV